MIDRHCRNAVGHSDAHRHLTRRVHPGPALVDLAEHRRINVVRPDPGAFEGRARGDGAQLDGGQVAEHAAKATERRPRCRQDDRVCSAHCFRLPRA